MKKGILLFVCIVMFLPILLHGEVKQVKVWGKIIGLAGREVVLLDSDCKTEIARVKGNKDRFELTAKVEIEDARPYFLYLPALGNLDLSMHVPVMYFFIDTENIQIEAKIENGNLASRPLKSQFQRDILSIGYPADFFDKVPKSFHRPFEVIGRCCKQYVHGIPSHSLVKVAT